MFSETLLIIIFVFFYILISNTILNRVWKALKFSQPGANVFLNIFYNSLLFSLLLVSIVAVIKAKGQTVFIFSFPIFYFLISSYKKQNVPDLNIAPSYKKTTTWIAILFLSIITVLCSYYYSLKFSVRNDTAHYVKIAENLISNGLENPYQYYNAENAIFNGLTPYHYFEMWFGGIFFKINELIGLKLFSNYLLYIYAVFNIFRVIAIIGIFGLISKYVKFNALYFIIVIPLLVIDISAYCNWLFDSYVAESNFFERPNFIFYYLFLVPVFDAILTNNRSQLAIWSTVFIVASITSLPSIAGGLMLKLTYDFFKYKEEKRSIIRITTVFVGFLFAVAVFYKIFGVVKEAMPIDNLTAKQMLAKTLSIWKACVYMFAILIAKISVLIVLIYFIISTKFSGNYKFNGRFKDSLIYVALLCLIGIALFQLAPYVDNMYQFAFVGYCAVMLMLMLVLVVRLFNLTDTKKYIFTTITLILIFIGYKRNLFYDHITLAEVNWNLDLKENFLMQGGLSYSYIKTLESEAPELLTRNGASIIDGDDAGNDFLGLRHSATYQLGNYFMAFNNQVHLPLLSDKSKLYPDKDTTNKDYYKALNFNKKTAFYKNYNNTISYRDNLRNYINNNKIDYIFASKNVSPTQYLDSSLIDRVIKDNNKQHKLILLKR